MGRGEIFWIGAGGFCGAILRVWVVDTWEGGFPWGILLVNVSGSILLALSHGLKDQIRPQARHFYAVGFCGSLTTVSAFSLAATTLSERIDLLLLHVGLNLCLSLPLVAVVIWMFDRTGGAREEKGRVSS